MTNAQIEFEIKGVKYSLYFGMSAIEIFSTKSVQELQRLAIEFPTVKLEDLKADNVKSFAYIVYAGLCNSADKKDLSRPTFQKAYELSEEICFESEELQASIFETFNESRANKLLQEKLNGKQKKSDPEAVK
jgi:hypothetical protein